MRNLFRIFSVFLIISSLFIIFNCVEEEESGPVIAELTGYGSCKDFGTREGEDSTSMECVEYEYDEANALYLKHINAGFNCAPGEIWAEFNIEDNLIEITENQLQSVADCNCLYDLEYELKNIKPGSYIINFSGPLATLVFIVNLKSHSGGSYCVERSEYPWF
jgi:hypothetical protein